MKNNEIFLEQIPIVYDRFRSQKHDRLLPVHIFGTSSKGNSVYIKNLHLLIDLGLPFKRYTEYNLEFFNDVDYIILTHEHGDHLNPSTLLKILKIYPHIKVLITKRMAHAIMSESFSHRIKQDILRLYTTNDNLRFMNVCHTHLKTRDLVDVEFIPHITKHGDITNIAIELNVPQLSLHLLYASDLDNLYRDVTGETDGLPHYKDNPFNLIFLEANYDEELLHEALRLDPNDIRAKGNLRHISEQAAWQYVQKYLTDKGYFIPLHASGTYGTLNQFIK